jgi:hypothetical protein
MPVCLVTGVEDEGWSQSIFQWDQQAMRSMGPVRSAIIEKVRTIAGAKAA